MNRYQEMREKHQKEISDFPMFFAFNKDQFAEGMKKLGLRETQTYLVCQTGFGGYCRKSDSRAYAELLMKQHRELRNALMTNDEFLSEALDYELGNHEYVVTCDASDALSALDLTYSEVRKNERLYNALQKACKAQLEWYAKFG